MAWHDSNSVSQPVWQVSELVAERRPHRVEAGISIG
jgi:hypothetical protein